MGDHPSKPSDYVDCVEVTVKNGEDGYEIPCKLWKPKGRIRATALFIHGGMFSKGDRDSHPSVSEALAAQVGIAVLTATFRDGSVANHKSGKTMGDLTAATQYLQKRYCNEAFGIIGSSSGGFFALALCNEMDLGEVKFCIPLCPVANPHARAVYLRHCIDGTTPLNSGKDLYNVRHTSKKAQYILSNQMQYFGTFKEMATASDSVEDNMNKVPTLLVLASTDANVPQQAIQQTVHSWASRTIIIGGAGHEIQDVPPADFSQSYMPDIERFLRSVLKDEPYEPLWRVQQISD